MPSVNRIGPGSARPLVSTTMRPKRRISPASRRSIRLRSVSRQILAHRAAQAAAGQLQDLAFDEIDEVVVDRDLADLVDDDGGVGKRRVGQARGAAASSCRCRETRSAASAECVECRRAVHRIVQSLSPSSFHAGMRAASGGTDRGCASHNPYPGEAGFPRPMTRTDSPAIDSRGAAACASAQRNARLHSLNCAIIMPAITRPHTRPAREEAGQHGGNGQRAPSEPDIRGGGIRCAARRAHGVEAVRRRARGRGCLDRGPARRDRLDHRPERRRQDLAAQHDQRLLSSRTAARSPSRASTRPAFARPRSPRSGSPARFRTSRCSAA